MTTTVGAHRFRYVAPPAAPTPAALWDYFQRLNDDIARAVNPVRSVADGGTGTDTFVAGDLLVSTAANSLARLAIGTTNQVLRVVAGLPAWATLTVPAVLDDLTDVVITTPATGHTLRYDGVNWINTNVLNIGTADVTLSGQLGFSTAITQVIPGATSLSFRNNADSADNILIANAGGITFRGALSGATTESLAGPITLTTAASKIIPGATSLSFRNNADSADNLLISNVGDVTVRARLLMATALSKIVPGATSLTFRNNADTASNLVIADGGDITTRAAVTISSINASTGLNVNATAGAGNGYISIGDTGTQAPFAFVYDSNVPRFYMGFNGSTGADMIFYAKGRGTGQTHTMLADGTFRLETGPLKFSVAVSQLIPGATSFAVRNNANSADNLLISNAGALTHRDTTLLHTSVALTNGAAAAAGTLLNAPVAGNPTKWVPIDDNGTTRYIPAW